MVSDISPIIDLLTAHNPNHNTSSYRTAQMWLNEGCDIEKDILPVLQGTISRRAASKKPPLFHLNYIQEPVYQARDKRKALESSNDPANADKHRAISLACKRKYGIGYGTHDENFLKRYEQENGVVPV